MANNAPANYSDLAASVFVDIVAPDYREEVQDVVTWRRWWRKIANFTEGVAHIMLGIGTILAYAAGFFDNKYISFAAGCCSTVCLVLLRYSVYANQESADRNTILDRLLAAAGLGPAPSIADEGNAKDGWLPLSTSVPFVPVLSPLTSTHPAALATTIPSVPTVRHAAKKKQYKPGTGIVVDVPVGAGPHDVNHYYGRDEGEIISG